MKLTVNKSKNSASFYVQKTIRKSNGNITTVTVEKLGNLTEVTAKAAGKDPYVWAQEYVNELNRKEYEENKEIINSYSPSRLLKKWEQKSFNCGYLFLQKIYYELGLVFTRILYPASKSSSYRLAAKFIEQPSFELHDIYRAGI